jgi:NADH:ubiquinone oxidoreductase subunit 6 (subunit J)
MLTANIDKLTEEAPPTMRLLGATVAASAMAALLLNIVWSTPQWLKAAPQPIPEATTSLIGELFMGDFALVFIASSIAILVALVGAAMIGRSDRLAPEEAAERM